MKPNDKRKFNPGRIEEIEARLCSVCKKPITTRGWFWKKETCSRRCKIIRWALIEANKAGKP